MIKVLQITDLHLGADENYRLAGVNTLHTFGKVLERVRDEQFELLMVTGDISASANLRSYETFFERIKVLNKPALWLPGNHDLLPAIGKVDNAIPFRDVLDIGNWRIIMLNSVVEECPGGRLGEVQLENLNRLLEENTQPNVLISLHHQPVAVGSKWLDQQKIEDADRFMSIVERYPSVKSVLWGHVHQEFDAHINGCRFLATPSTCIQFKANSDEFAIDSLSPGYRLLDLNDDGSINSKVVRVEIEDFGIDLDCVGY